MSFHSDIAVTAVSLHATFQGDEITHTAIADNKAEGTATVISDAVIDWQPEARVNDEHDSAVVRIAIITIPKASLATKPSLFDRIVVTIGSVRMSIDAVKDTSQAWYLECHETLEREVHGGGAARLNRSRGRRPIR